MCPVTMMVISIALSIAMMIVQQKQVAARAKAEAKAAKMKFAFDKQQALARANEERMKASQLIEVSRMNQAALGGVAKNRRLTGRGIAALRREVARVGDRAVTTAKTNFEFAAKQAQAKITGAHLQMGTTLMRIEQPDWVGAGLKIAASAVGSATTAYNTRQSAQLTAPDSLAARY